MNLLKLKREVLPVRFPLMTVIICSLLGALSLNVGLKVACEDRQTLQMTESVAAAEVCGITDPLACVTSILESVTDLFRPEAPLVMTVTYTATTVSAPTCGDIMDMFHTLPGDRLLEMPGLLEQVAECKAHYRSSSVD